MPGRVLVTGGTGFLGRHLLPALLAQERQVRVLARREAPWLDERVEFMQGSFADTRCLGTALADCDAVVHLACSTIPRSSNQNPVADIENNLAGTVRLLEACREHGCRRVVFTSSGGTVYGNVNAERVTEEQPASPISSYGIVKLAIEKYLAMYGELYGFRTVSLRIANMYGEHQPHDTGLGAIAAFAHSAVNGQPIEIWGDGTIARDFVYVGDVVAAILASLEAEKPGLVLNIGSGKSVSINEIVELVGKVSGRTVEKIHLPGRKFDVRRTCLDIAKAERELGWKPATGLQEGIARVLDSTYGPAEPPSAPEH